MKTTVKSIIKSLNINKDYSYIAYGSRLNNGNYVFTNGHILYELTKNNKLNNELLSNVIDYLDAVKIAGYTENNKINRNTCKLNDNSLELAKNRAYRDCFDCKKIDVKEFVSLFDWLKKIKNASTVKFVKHWLYVLDKQNNVIDKTITNIDLNMKLNFKYLVQVFRNMSNIDHGCTEIITSDKAMILRSDTVESIIMSIKE